jgi:hypothetical protein
MKRRAPRVETPDELEFQQHLMLKLGATNTLRLWRQNVGSVPIRDRLGKVVRVFHAGPPTGASDLSGIVRPEGWRLEIELKSADGTRSLEQIRWGDFITASGGVYVLLAYDAGLSLADNVERAASAVLCAIDARRRAA